jgi:hypothetical protein
VWYVWETGSVHIRFWWGVFRRRDPLKDLGIDRRIILKYALKIYDGEAWSGLIWLRIGTGGVLLRMRL